jgi:hypothetical protein
MSDPPALPPALVPTELDEESVLPPLHAAPLATKIAIAIEPRQATLEVMASAMACRSSASVFENARADCGIRWI